MRIALALSLAMLILCSVGCGLSANTTGNASDGDSGSVSNQKNSEIPFQDDKQESKPDAELDSRVLQIDVRRDGWQVVVTGNPTAITEELSTATDVKGERVEIKIRNFYGNSKLFEVLKYKDDEFAWLGRFRVGGIREFSFSGQIYAYVLTLRTEKQPLPISMAIYDADGDGKFEIRSEIPVPRWVVNRPD